MRIKSRLLIFILICTSCLGLNLALPTKTQANDNRSCEQIIGDIIKEKNITLKPGYETVAIKTFCSTGQQNLTLIKGPVINELISMVGGINNFLKIRTAFYQQQIDLEKLNCIGIKNTESGKTYYFIWNNLNKTCEELTIKPQQAADIEDKLLELLLNYNLPHKTLADIVAELKKDNKGNLKQFLEFINQNAINNTDQANPPLITETCELYNRDGLSNKLKVNDFEEMELFAKYLVVKLDSCSKKDQIHCNLNLDDKKRLSTLINLTALGSASSVLDNTKLGELPEKHFLQPERNSDMTAGSCSLFSDLNGILNSPHNQLSSGTACVFSGGTKNTNPQCATSRLLLNCATSPYCHDLQSCKKIIGANDPRGLLSPYKTQAMFLQTLYWNIIDRGYTGVGAETINWTKLSATQKTEIERVIASPDSSPTRPCQSYNLPQINQPHQNSNQSLEKLKIACEVEGGLGWTLCDTTNHLLNSFDTSYQAFSNLMNSGSGLTTSKNQVQQIWQTGIGIANVLIVIVLLIIIFSQITGYGLNSYQVKTMLPKLIVAAILANLSFIIAQLLFDSSNLIGQGLRSGIIDITNLSAADTAMTNEAMRAQFWNSGLGKNALDIIALIILGFLWLVTLVIQVFILGLRDVMIIIGIVLAPIMLVLRLLPNTKRSVDLWTRALLFCLIIQPVANFIFGIARIAFLVSNQTSVGFIGAITSRTILIIPLLTTPYLLFKFGKNIPLLGVQLARLQKFTSNLIRGTLPKPKEGSWREYRQKLQQTRSDQASRGEYINFKTGRMRNLGRIIRHPFLAGRSLMVQAGNLSTGRILAPGTAAIAAKRGQARGQAAQGLSLNEANNILSHFGVGSSASRPKLDQRSAGINHILASGFSRPEVILTASLAKLQQEQAMGQAANIQSFVQALSLARRWGAAQDDLQNTYAQSLEIFKGSGNFAATGDLKAFSTYYTDPSNGFSDSPWGNYDETMWTQWTDNNGRDTSFTTLRKKVIRSEMIHQVLEQPLDANDQKVTLNAAIMPPNSLALEVFKHEFNTSEAFEEEIREQMPNFSYNTRTTLDQALHGGLLYDALSANLSQNQLDRLNDYRQGLLNSTDETKLRDEIFRIKGSHSELLNVATAHDIDLERLAQQVQYLPGAFDLDNYSDLIGWSFRNVVHELTPSNNPTELGTELASDTTEPAALYRKYLSEWQKAGRPKSGSKYEDMMTAFELYAETNPIDHQDAKDWALSKHQADLAGGRNTERLKYEDGEIKNRKIPSIDQQQAYEELFLNPNHTKNNSKRKK